MTASKSQLSEMFNRLEAELTRLEDQRRPEEELWDAFERLLHVPSASIDPKDRLWWWEQVYSAMERHGLTELSQQHLAREFP